MKDLTHKMAQFFCGEDFAEHGDNARLELTPAELRQISNLMTENAKLKTKLNKHGKAFENTEPLEDALSNLISTFGIEFIEEKIQYIKANGMVSE